jgi:hypothetical protein
MEGEEEVGLEVEGRGTFGDDERLSHCKCVGAGLDFLRERVAARTDGAWCGRRSKCVRCCAVQRSTLTPTREHQCLLSLPPTSQLGIIRTCLERARAHTPSLITSKEPSLSARVPPAPIDSFGRRPTITDGKRTSAHATPRAATKQRESSSCVLSPYRRVAPWPTLPPPPPPDWRRAKRCSAGRSSSSSC